ncbi:chemotaxis protein MotC [Methylobacterium sp. UNC378MF]|uniref:chemotaxis protein n=1 Tax=Methylobacterium sp. UNC378MF TaxID=1502748 RepID=UPI0008818B60|nr:chemotaxis protein [Methylobacterium sp. UNC378MF]SDA11547.1 chemotaxis protein MotC [Methylobacterium sp. UNC378MF]
MRRIVRGLIGLIAAGLAVPGVAQPVPPLLVAPQVERQPNPDPIPSQPPVVAPPAGTGGPVAWVRTLQLLQDRIAAGSLIAHESQPLLIARINADLLNAAPDVWADRHNLHAAVAFALSGGGPAVLQHLIAREDLAEPEASLARGALAYIEGRASEARRLLGEIDTAGLPPALAGAVGLTQASLTLTENPVRAIDLLDRVRLLLPGTLAEEGALRREIFTLGQVGDLKKFESLAIQYLRRYPHSVYAGNFRQRLGFQLTQFNVAEDPARLTAMNRILSELDPESRRDLYLLIARTAIGQGKTAATLLIADRALALCAPGSPEAARARLYRAAAEIVNLATFKSGLLTLRNLDRSNLPAGDLPLLATALSTAEEIGRGLGGRSLTPEAESASPRDMREASADRPDSLIPKAQSTIDHVDLLLSKARP